MKDSTALLAHARDARNNIPGTTTSSSLTLVAMSDEQRIHDRLAPIPASAIQPPPPHRATQLASSLQGLTPSTSNPSDHKCALHHPNPRPGDHPHFSSLEHLRLYINDEVEAFRRCLDDPENEYFREEAHAAREARERRVRIQEAVRALDGPSGSASGVEPQLQSQSQSEAQASSSSSSTSAPNMQDTFTASQSQSQPKPQAIIEDPEPTPLDPATRAAIEAYIPASILRLSICVRTTGLRAWFMYLQQSQHAPEDTLPPPQRKRKVMDGAVVPWEQGFQKWEGSLDAEATEVVELCACEDRIDKKVVKVETREIDVRSRSQGKKKKEAGLCEGSVDEAEVLDVRDGHVLGKDWALGKGGKTMLVHENADKNERGGKAMLVHENQNKNEQGGEEDRVRKNSVFEKMAGLSKKRRFP